MCSRIIACLIAFLVVQRVDAGTTFRVTLDPAARGEPATGRLVLMLVKEGADIDERTEPLDGPFWGKGQPIFGMDIAKLMPGAAVTVDDAAESFPTVPSKLAPGNYRVQARLDCVRRDSEWKRETGNVYSKEVKFTVGAESSKPIELRLDQKAGSPERPAPPGCEVFEMRSKLLSDFRGYDVMLRAGVVMPSERDAARAYPAVYEVPGFGGDHTGAYGVAAGMLRKKGDLRAGGIHEQAFWIVLDPESPNGHTLFADSANNGPCGRALVEELIPALDKKYNLIPKPAARLLRGHSSGGWSTLWLALNYPETFGACWSSSPDPVDFRKFQVVDIYGQPNMYTMMIPGESAEADMPSTRSEGKMTMTIREENAIEEAFGPRNTSGQQWDSWQAAFGPRDAKGNVAALYDPKSGMIDPIVANQYRKYDLCELVKKNKGTMGLVFHQRIRLVVGDQDTFYLNEAVALLKPEVERLSFFQYPEGRNGYIKIVPGKDHGTIFSTPELQAFDGEMVEHLKKNGMVKEAEAGKK